MWRKGGQKAPQYWKLENQEIEKPGLRKRSRKKKIIKGNIRKEGKKKSVLVYQPFRSASLKVINFHGRISLRDYSL